MAEQIKMPQLGLTMTEGTLGKWKKNIGDAVAVGDVLVEVMTDKITSEIEAPAAGVLRVIAAGEGQTVPVQGLLAVIGTADEPIDEGGAAQQPAAAPAGTPTVKAEVKFSAAARRLAEEKGIAIQSVPGSGPDGRITVADVEKYLAAAPPAAAGGRIKASPLAKRTAAQLAVDLAGVAGTGPGGRIVEDDVKNAAASVVPAPAPVAAAGKAPAEPVKGQPLSGMRKVIAERMMASKNIAPHVTMMTEVNVGATVAFRSELNSRNAETRLTYTDLITKMAAAALRRFPAMNASLIDNALLQHEDINIGVAVALDNGLLVPVVRNTDRCGLQEIHHICKDNALKARNNQLGLEALSGGTFTISNLGGYDIDGFTPIINQPETAILGVGRIVKKPAVVDDELVAASMMTLSLSFDHRVVDGAQAAQFLQCIKRYLEDPLRLLL